MLGRVAVCGAAAAMMLPILFLPVPSPARGAGFHAGAQGAFWRGRPPIRRGHAAFARGHFRHARNYRNRYWGDDGYGYAYLPPGFADGDYAPQEIVVPAAYPIYVGPRCVHSVETVIVPAELGGERRIRITRC